MVMIGRLLFSMMPQIIKEIEPLCNMCGKSMCPNEENKLGKWYSEYPHGLINAKVDGGYESFHLLDMSRYTFSFCERCLRELFVQCKIKPKINSLEFGTLGDQISYVEGQEDSWERDQSAYEDRLWRANGGDHQAYLNRKCNTVKECPNEAIYTVKLSGDFTEVCCCEEHKNKHSNTVNATLVKFIPNVLKPFL